MLADVSDEIEQWRQDMFSTATDDVQSNIERLRHTLSTVMSVEQMVSAVGDFGEDVNEIALDPTTFAQAVKDDDVDEVRRQLTSGLEKWETEMLKWSEQNNYDTSTLVGHPSRTVKMGGSSFKRPISP